MAIAPTFGDRSTSRRPRWCAGFFALSAEGAGLTRITKALNAAGLAAPRPQQGRPAGWVSSTVRDVLLRPLYRGEIVWNQTRKRDRWGQSRRANRPDEDAVRVAAPELQIVSDALWAAAHARMGERQQKHTRPQRHLDVDSAYLLSGFARCKACGGGFAAHSRNHGGQRVHFYGCTFVLETRRECLRQQSRGTDGRDRRGGHRRTAG